MPSSADERLAALPHGLRDAGEVALFPKRLVRVHFLFLRCVYEPCGRILFPHCRRMQISPRMAGPCGIIAPPAFTREQERCDVDSIRSAISQASDYLAEHPDEAIGTDSAATAVREDGLRFRVDGPWASLTSDMAKSVGGGASAPTPGWLLRGALAACDATLVAMEAARDGVDLTELEVSVESESDFRGILGVDSSVHPGPLSVRVRTRVAAVNATDDQLRTIVERAESRSPVRDALARDMTMTTEVATA